jgi:serine/threonine protein kinase
VSSSILRRGGKLDRYEVRQLIGQGGMGEVYRAWDSILQRDVALKILAVRDDEMLKRFQREAEVIGRLDNPNVVEVHDFRMEGEHPYIVMEYLRGESLRDRLTKGLLPVAEVINMALGVCRGVGACHSVGIIHRDLKPANVFLAETAHYGTVVKVLDFGVAKPVSFRVSELTGPGKLVGTPRYFAPEQLKGADADKLSDQYAVGLLLHAALTGKPPFFGKEGKDLIEAILGARYPRPKEVRGDVPAQLEAVILKALSTDRGQRYPSVRDLGRALVLCLPAEDGVLWSESFAPQPERSDARTVASTVVMAASDVDLLVRRSVEDADTEQAIVRGAQPRGQGSVVASVAPAVEDPHLSSSTENGSSPVPEPRERTWKYDEDLFPAKLRGRLAGRKRLDPLLIILLAAAGVGLAAIAVLVLSKGHRMEIEISAPKSWATVTLDQNEVPTPDGGLPQSRPSSATLPPKQEAHHSTSAKASADVGADSTASPRHKVNRHPDKPLGFW